MDDRRLEAIAENDAHAEWIVEHHTRTGDRITSDPYERLRCSVCETWWPCDLVSLAALAVLNARRLARAGVMLGSPD